MLLQIKSNVDNDLIVLESKLINNLESSYQFINKSFLDFRTKIIPD